MKRWIVVACTVAFVAHADADTKKRVKPPETKTAAAKGFWKVLVKPNAKWVLRETAGEAAGKNNANTITVETYDVRKVAGADVARLRWTLNGGEDMSGIGGQYTQLGVTSAGLYILTAEMDDAKIATRLKDKPSRSDPPKAYMGTKQNHGRYLRVEDNGNVCMGEGAEPGAGACEDVCEGYLCISPTDGIVGLFGNWAPGVSIFEK